MLALATFYWGLSFPVIKSIVLLNRALFPGAGSWFMAAEAVAPRYLVAAALMLVFAGRRIGRPTRGELWQGAGLGLFASAATLFQTDGMQYTAASTSAFLTQFAAILIPSWVAFRSRRNPGFVVWACCVLVLVGVGILGHFDWRTLHLGRGEWETLLCSLFFMAQILLLEKKEFSGNRPASITLVMFSVQALAFQALAAATMPSARALVVPWVSPAWLGLTLVLAVICTIGAFSIMNRWQREISATEAGLIYCLEPVMASGFALFLPGIISTAAGIQYPNEFATSSLVVGGGLIMMANVIVQVRAGRSQ
jgi:drug/metabolite transporter (DMT)-like permease